MFFRFPPFYRDIMLLTDKIVPNVTFMEFGKLLLPEEDINKLENILKEHAASTNTTSEFVIYLKENVCTVE